MDKQNSRDSQAPKDLSNAELLKESEEHFRMMFENSRDGIVMVDNMGRFVKANSAYCAMLGYTIDELRKMENFYEVTPEKWRDWEREEIWFNRLFKSGYSGVYEKEYIRKNGEVFPVELNSFAVFGKDGRPVILFGIARDITERKKAEEELRESQRFLEMIIETVPT